MAMIKCENCQYEVSQQTTPCKQCGHPQINESAIFKSDNSPWTAVTKSRTPINIFAIAMMACASILGISAVQIDNEYALIAFTYTLHIFLAVTGMFFITILFCRKAAYHPNDLANANKAGLSDFGNDNPLLAAILIGAMLLLYGIYKWTQ